MLKQILAFLLTIGLFLIDLNTIAIPYIIFVFGLLFYYIKLNKFNEILLAIVFFGFSFFSLVSITFNVPNIGLIIASIFLIFLYRFYVNWRPFEKLPLTNNKFILLTYSILFILIVYSISNSFILKYQLFKIELLYTWFLIFIFAINSFDKNIVNFDYDSFLTLSFFLFVPHFALPTEDGLTQSPQEMWEIFSIKSSGLRGTGFDIITASRYAGLGLLTFMVYIFDVKIEKLYLYPMVGFFVIMLIICQTRQALAAAILPILIYLSFNIIHNKKNYLGLVLSIILSGYLLFNYINYLDENNVETRLVENVEGNADEGTGREFIWDSAWLLITKNQTNLGFGNFKFYALTHDYAHNIFLELWIEAGGLSALILLIISLYMFIEVIKVLFIYKKTNNFSLLLLLASVYYFTVSQFSVDISRNLNFFFTFALYLTSIKSTKKVSNE